MAIATTIYLFHFCFTTPENEHYDYKIELVEYRGVEGQMAILTLDMHPCIV